MKKEEMNQTRYADKEFKLIKIALRLIIYFYMCLQTK